MADVDALFEVFDESEQSNVSPISKKNKPNKNTSQNSTNPVDGTVASGSSLSEILKRHREQDRNEVEDENKKLKLSIVDELRAMDALPRLQLHTVETQESCTHEVALPPDVAYVPLKPAAGTPAKEYPFILDPFQREALLCLENTQSVLVSAHTSAGKTVVAEYAIAMSLRDKQRVIYTTPIKALSNQKFRELSEEFGDVGLMTGDVTINPNASCLVMTTEILRSMLYRGSELMREVAWVVFDEIHYMRDKERGVVWEETIILLPDNVHYVFLSATIPNASQFAEWIAHLHKQPCHVVYTDYRPTPLQHYIHPAGSDGLHLVVDESGTFREDNFNKAMSALHEVGDASQGDRENKGRKGGAKQTSNCFRIVKMVMERNFAPVIVFSFSKKDCEAYAIQMAKLDFNTKEEKKLVEEVFTNAIDSLSDEDKKLPQVEHVLPLLKKGIGIHHSGLLPLLKETIEIMFSEGLIKALFATETFAMGLNMPARTVVFTSARKFDGVDYRWVTSGEYIQMSGRAGRRGLDDRGIVIQMIDDRMSPAIAKDIVQGQADPLNSSFHLTYNMVLNLLRVEEINPEYMLERSFYQFQNYSSLPGLAEKLKSLEQKHSSIKVPREHVVASYYAIRDQLSVMSESLMDFIRKPKYLLSFLQPGRLLYIKHDGKDFGWAAVVNFHKSFNPKKDDQVEKYSVEVLMEISEESASRKDIYSINPPDKIGEGKMQVVPVLLKIIQKISAVRLYIPNDLTSESKRQSVFRSIQEVKKRFPKGLPLLDPITDMGIQDPEMKNLVMKIEAFEKRMYQHELHEHKDLKDLLDLQKQKLTVADEIKACKSELKKKRSLLQMDELKCRKRVLRRLGYATAQDAIEMKGRVACEISSADELLMTELLFNGVFNELSVSQTCALVSCFVFQESNNGPAPALSEELSGPLRIMQETARRIAKVSREAKLDIDEDKYVQGFVAAMMDVVSAWCKGKSFAEICKMTDIFEGSIIRCMRRLEETLRQLCQAAKAIGNADLENKFSEGIRQIKRDIIFAASLYL